MDVSQVGLISSPSYPQVPPSSDLDCTWTLKVPDTDLIELHFQSSKVRTIFNATLKLTVTVFLFQAHLLSIITVKPATWSCLT